MVHDDDTGKRVEFPVSGKNPNRPSPPGKLPPQEVQDEIIELGKTHGPDRIRAKLLRKGLNISRDIISYILDRARTGR